MNISIKDWQEFNETTRYCIIDDPDEAGYLELPPLDVLGGAVKGQAILHPKDSLDDESPKRFIYVWPEELEEIRR